MSVRDRESETNTRSVEFRGQFIQVRDYGVRGPKLIKLPFFADERGLFGEVYSAALFKACGLPTSWAQDNLSHSHKYTLRGMHIQRYRPQGKLIHCIQGAIQDVAIDLRPGLTFGYKYTTALSSESSTHDVFYVPVGFAHGFLALTDAIVHYKCTTPYDSSSDGGVHFSEFQGWAKAPKPYRISTKDQRLPSVMDYAKNPG